MAALTQIDRTSLLHHDRWSRLTSDGEKLSSRDEVWGVPDVYRFDSGLGVTINADHGPKVRVRYCGQGDFDCNFLEAEALLAAADPDTVDLPNHAPIRLTFSQPVKAVGCHVAGAGGADLYGEPFMAVLYARRQGQAQWEVPVAKGGVLGHAIKPGTLQGLAPFVGVRDDSGAGIEAVTFDVALMANFRFAQVAISTLYYLL